MTLWIAALTRWPPQPEDKHNLSRSITWRDVDFIICPVAIVYSIKHGTDYKTDMCLLFRLRALSRSHFLIDFHQNWHRRKNPQQTNKQTNKQQLHLPLLLLVAVVIDVVLKVVVVVIVCCCSSCCGCRCAVVAAAAATTWAALVEKGKTSSLGGQHRTTHSSILPTKPQF